MRKVSTGLKCAKKTIFVGDVIKFTPNEHTSDLFHNHPLGKVLKETGYKSIYIRVQKHKWLELDLVAFIEGTESILAEQGLVNYVAATGETEGFDHEYTETAPNIYAESLMDTTFLRFLLDQDMDISKEPDFESILSKSEEFYLNATREIHMINMQKEKENAGESGNE
jgi:hypothetical protein